MCFRCLHIHKITHSNYLYTSTKHRAVIPSHNELRNRLTNKTMGLNVMHNLFMSLLLLFIVFIIHIFLGLCNHSHFKIC